MPITTPITNAQNVNYIIANSTLQFLNATAGGTWSSSNTGIVSIDSTSGIATGVTAGLVVITYTISGDIATFSLNAFASNISNGFDTQQVLSAANNRVLWQSQGSSDSGRYYQDFHALCDENIIKQLQPIVNPDSPTYSSILSSLNRSIILDGVNGTYNNFQTIDKAKLIFNRTGYDRLFLQPIQNQSQYVGLSWSIADGDVSVSFKKLILWFTKAMTFNMYLFNDMVDAPIATFPVTTMAYSQTVIPVTGLMGLILSYLAYNNNAISGRWFLGYKQDDIEAQGGQALYFNIEYGKFRAINVLAFSATIIADPVNPATWNFNRTTIGANNLMYGMNAELVTYQDPTSNIIENLSSGLYDNLFGYLMAAKIIEMIIFSYRNNKAQVNLMGNANLEQLYAELNAVESANPNELNYSDGLRKRVEEAKRVVKEGMKVRRTLFAGCG